MHVAEPGMVFNRPTDVTFMLARCLNEPITNSKCTCTKLSIDYVLFKFSFMNT